MTTVRRTVSPIAFALLLAASTGAQTSNPGPRNFKMLLDGAETPGIAGFAVDFERDPTIAYSPRRIAAPAASPRLTLTATPKGLNALQAWLNDAGNGNSPAARSIEIQAVDNEGVVLIDWRLDNVEPIAISETSSGTGSSPTAAVVFAFEKLTLIRAKAD
jgi:hypothetical protein